MTMDVQDAVRDPVRLVAPGWPAGYGEITGRWSESDLNDAVIGPLHPFFLVATVALSYGSCRAAHMFSPPTALPNATENMLTCSLPVTICYT